MRQYDLDDIAPLEPLLAELGQALTAAVAETLGGARPTCEIQDLPPFRRGERSTLEREIRVTAASGESKLGVLLRVYRFVHPPEGAVDNAMELAVVPVSAKAHIARLMWLFFTPLVGVAGGLLLWRLLQWDTNMDVVGWLVAGGMVGLVVGVWGMIRYAHQVGALLEGRGTLSGWSQRRRVAAGARAVIDRLVTAHRERSRSAAEGDEAATPLPREPEALARYTAALAKDPDDALRRYGLAQAKNRAAVRATFALLERDLEMYAAYTDELDRLRSAEA